MSFEVPRIVEGLIQGELYNERRKYKCTKCRRAHKLDGAMPAKDKKGGSIEHGEWYEVSVERALEVVQRWRLWVVHNKPYNVDGTLWEAWIWKHHVANR